MCEPLIGKRKDYSRIKTDYDEYVEFSYNKYGFLFDDYDVKSAVKFYQRYGIGDVVDPWNTLKNECEDIYNEFLKWVKKEKVRIGSTVWVFYYRKWLYNYCFKDVIE